MRRSATFVALILALAILGAAAGTRAAPPLPDQGVFPDLDDRVQIGLPAWVGAPTLVVRDEAHGMAWAFAGDAPFGVAPAGAGPIVTVRSLEGCDADGDGIPDASTSCWGRSAPFSTPRPMAGTTIS